MRKKIFLITLLSMVILTGCAKETKKEESKIVENNGMLSYTIDGEKTDIKPSKEDGYIVNKIICDNGSDMMWDNDNWEVELTKINSKDRCKVDFTKDTSKEGYRITVTSNSTSSLDSLSKATTLNGTVIIYSKSSIKNITGCNGSIKDNKVIVSNVTSNQTCNIEIELKTLVDVIKLAYNASDDRHRIDFSKIDNGTHADTPGGLTGGLYTAEDDDGLTYYFSGNGTSMNNWVKFADKWWRIIRINGNGSIRLLYSGDGNTATDLGGSRDEKYRHPASVGWKYTYISSSISVEVDRGNINKSGAYSKVETWYNGLSSIDKNYIDMEAIYCNDRDLASGSTYSTSSTFYYAPYTRLSTSSPNPTFKCSNKADKFPHKNSNGELIEIPVGLITADEVVYAGGSYSSNNEKAYYCLAKDGSSDITKSNSWWTMTPCFFQNGAEVFTVGGSSSGSLGIGWVNLVRVIRPVISLKSGVLVTSGDGSAESPYEITI